MYQDKPPIDELMHYGIKRRSGRYPWGSGKEPYQHSGDFLSRVESLRSQNFSYTDEYGKKWTGDTAIAKSMGLSTNNFRTQVSLAKDERRMLQIARIKSLQKDGLNNSQIGQIMGKNESSIRSLLKEESKVRMEKAKVTADFLKKQIDEKGMIDVGKGVERELGVSKEKMEQALEILRTEGYEVYGGRVPQVTNPGKQTTIKVACPPGTKHKDIYQYDKINSVRDYISYDGGDTFKPAFAFPASMDSKRLKVRYAEEGGIEKDGVIELRRGVDDLSLGKSHYAQVRILVDGDRYLKGMAVYSDNMPDGVDVIFNTNKKAGTPMRDVLKEVKTDKDGNIDRDNPFGSLIKERGGQSYYIDKNGKEKLSLINKRAEEGDWGEWSDYLSSQFLSKQNMDLINKQLNLSAADKKAEFDEICSLTNPVVKKKMLKSFADDCDAAAVHLKAAALPRQKYQVILPIPSMSENEVYAPNYNDGEKVALVRYPHGGTFEIPILTVNNKQREASRVLGKTPADVIGINSKVAERLSGADFDGDTVMVIPTNSKVRITSTPRLDGLKDFDPKSSYPYREGMRLMKDKSTGKDNTQIEMGIISNLITDMTLKGADEGEITRAVKHSMVVIDAGKHKLDYKQSEIDNDIAGLKKKYQGYYDENGRYHEGAATLISRAKSQVSIPKRKGQAKIDPNTGEYIYKTDDTPYYISKTNARTGEVTVKTKYRTQQSTRMAEAKDARTLSSGTPQEEAYALYANTLKALGNQARKEMISTPNTPYSKSAKTVYQKEVDSLNAKLNIALKNDPRERQAQLIANAAIKAKKQLFSDMTKAEEKKVSQQELSKARLKVGAKRTPIVLTDREWEAIQAGAISSTKLAQIIGHVDADELKQRATPKTSVLLSEAKINKIQSMKASGYTTAEIAKAVGCSSSTVSKHLR